MLAHRPARRAMRRQGRHGQKCVSSCALLHSRTWWL